MKYCLAAAIAALCASAYAQTPPAQHGQSSQTPDYVGQALESARGKINSAVESVNKTIQSHTAFQVKDEKAVHYACRGGKTLAVSYFTVNDTPLASTSVRDKSLIFVNVVSASGTKYASGPYILWNKGNDAQLYDEMQTGAAGKLYDGCTTKPR